MLGIKELKLLKKWREVLRADFEKIEKEKAKLAQEKAAANGDAEEGDDNDEENDSDESDDLNKLDVYHWRQSYCPIFVFSNIFRYLSITIALF